MAAVEGLRRATGEAAMVMGRGEHEEDGRRYVSLAGLRMRGWTTGGLVHRLLGPPHRLSVDPRVRASIPVRPYRLERVEAAEQSHEFRSRSVRRGEPDREKALVGVSARGGSRGGKIGCGLGTGLG
ncbi:hypothetical protein ACWD3I_18635 [Streptomyces sp. NPDC002817]|uniref:hypothetical protein n=1 Tax=Streptomyces sp. NPDC088357 TaxID=3154655 RepID=UPI0034234441